jgi:hypothetical protein
MITVSYNKPFYNNMKRGFLHYSFISILLLIKPVYANTNDENLNFILNSIDPDSKTIILDKPKNPWQEAMSDYIFKISDLQEETKIKTNAVGNLLAKSSELSRAEDVLAFIKKVKQYKLIKKQHYDRLDNIMIITNKAIGKEHLTKKRLGGGNTYYEERLELFYLYDLNNYYHFILDNYKMFKFEGEKLLLAPSISKQYKLLSNKVISSYHNKDKIFKLKTNLLKDRMEELKEWNKSN